LLVRAGFGLPAATLALDLLNALGGLGSLNALGGLGALKLSTRASEVLYHGHAGRRRPAPGSRCAVDRSAAPGWRSAPAWSCRRAPTSPTSRRTASTASRPFPNFTDGLYLGYYAGMFVGVGLLLAARLRPIRRSLWLDGLVTGLALAAFTAAFVFKPLLASTEGDALTVAVTLGYPVADLVLVTFVGLCFCAHRLGGRTGRGA
jgi:hypothetical protein